MGKLSGKVALVTGAGSAHGRQIALALAAAGARLAVNDINPDRAAETIRQVEALGGQTLEVLADVSKKFAVQAMCNEIEDEWGGLDILVNNARVRPQRSLLEMDEWEWRRTLDVNLTGVFVMMQVAGRLMRAAGGGVIVNLIQPPPGQGSWGAYEAALAGIRQLTRAADQEFGEFGIRVVEVEGAGVDRILAEITKNGPA